MRAVRRTPDVTIEWSVLDLDDPRLDCVQCLYAVIEPGNDEIVNIGKASRSTIRERLRCLSKELLWEFMEDQFGCADHYVMIGEVTLNYEGRLTDKLLSYLESLLIFELDLSGNVLNTQSRPSRDGMLIECDGDWPGGADYFLDEEAAA